MARLRRDLSGRPSLLLGLNRSGQLGIGNNTDPQVHVGGAYSSKPLAVLRGLTYRHVTVGQEHSCGVTTDYRVFCWGHITLNNIGDTGGWLKFTPVMVSGNQQYWQVDAGSYHTCGVTLGNRAFCWGHGVEGQLGNGRPELRTATRGRCSAGSASSASPPVTGSPVARPRRTGCTAGGLRPESSGTAITRVSLTPVAVARWSVLRPGERWGGFYMLRQDAAGPGVLLGRRTIGGQLGNGTTTRISPTPVPVAGPM